MLALSDARVTLDTLLLFGFSQVLVLGDGKVHGI